MVPGSMPSCRYTRFGRGFRGTSLTELAGEKPWIVALAGGAMHFRLSYGNQIVGLETLPRDRAQCHATQRSLPFALSWLHEASVESSSEACGSIASSLTFHHPIDFFSRRSVPFLLWNIRILWNLFRHGYSAISIPPPPEGENRDADDGDAEDSLSMLPLEERSNNIQQSIGYPVPEFVSPHGFSNRLRNAGTRESRLHLVMKSAF
jgi:hypothetical protein